MKKKIRRVLKKVFAIALTTALVLPMSSYTQIHAVAYDNGYIEVDDRENITEAEEIEYYYALDDLGRLWYRIWSLTYGRWNTEWLLIG